MFNKLDFTRFGSNSTRNGFHSIKRQKSQRYLVVKKQDELTNSEPDFDDFNKIEFHEEQHIEYHEMYPEKNELFENNLEVKEEEPAVSLINVNHEITKLKVMASFLQNIDIQKAKKQSQKYERK
jgi:hypothetical protein